MDEAQRQRGQALLTTELYQQVRPVLITTYERGIIQGMREMALLVLETKFGPLLGKVRERVAALSREELEKLPQDFVKAQSLKELRLKD